jgi:hypothetical protein
MKIGRNAPCPCGSGKKYKKCCLLKQGAKVAFSQIDRNQALDKIEAFAMERLAQEDDDAYEEFYAPFPDDDLDTLDPSWNLISEEIFDMWFYFDRPLENGRFVVDLFMEQDPAVTAKERNYLKIIKGTSMRLYDVEDLVSGVSITFRDVINGSRVTVSERTASKTLTRHSCIYARINPQGASGKPEIERGCFDIPLLVKSKVIDGIRDEIKKLKSEHRGMTDTQCYKEMTPLLHEMWMSCILDPPIPALKNRDDEDILWTRVRFNVLDEKLLKNALDASDGFGMNAATDNEWHWTGSNAKGDEIILGRLELSRNQLFLETNSVERAAKGRALIEKCAGSSVRHHLSTHENVEAKLREKIRNHSEVFGKDSCAPDEIPREIAEELTLDYYAKYYRNWLDDSIPALDERTPREAAQSAVLRPKLVGLISDLERSYEVALKRGEPAFDPSWMWNELGMNKHSDLKSPPLLAHERLDQMVEGFGELCRALAVGTRKAPSFEDNETVIGESDVASTLDVQRFLRRINQADAKDKPRDSRAPETQLGSIAFITHAANHELYLRKTFWVDPELVYMLVQTDADVPGSDLKMPFKSFALMLRDRHALSLAERLLSIEGKTPLAGCILRVLTVYLTETSDGADRMIRVGLASDALGADLPQLFTIDVVVPDDMWMSEILEKAVEEQAAKVSKAAAERMGELLGIILNAVLYATSAGVEAKPRPAKEKYAEADSRPNHDAPVFTSEDVFYLPGPIDISSVKPLQELGRTTEGGKLLHRYMVRGHWRRPNPSWKDQRLRWIAPYWKGPDLAAIIERTYRLTP